MQREHESHAIEQTDLAELRDSFGRKIDYLRLSVTDRCDLRCSYCMAEHMTFLPRKELLSLEELYRLSCIFMQRGIRKIRITGGEPLARKNIMKLFGLLSAHLEQGGLRELTLTTNGTLLDRFAKPLCDSGVRRVNVSLDTLDAARYREITRWGRIEKVLNGIDHALAAGLKVKINTVAMKGAFEKEVDHMIRFAHERGMDITFIEEMPLGLVGHDRADSHLALSTLRAQLAERWTLSPLSCSTGGPARYMHVGETGGRIGFITPISCGFCASCNRIRVGSTGDLYTCMGQEGRVGLRDHLRSGEGDGIVNSLISAAIEAKPQGHSFEVKAGAIKGIGRHMSVLGG